jgi:metal-sulfur cluster biosynthetic enzyme
MVANRPDKTILSSVVVEELTKTYPECPVLSVYLEKAERLIQTVKNIRGSLLKQLIQFQE